jgi:hypothetical protein
MTLLLKVEDVFDISGQGCVIAPVVPIGADFKIRAKDQIQLRTPDGRVGPIPSTYLAQRCKATTSTTRDATIENTPVAKLSRNTSAQRMTAF